MIVAPVEANANLDARLGTLLISALDTQLRTAMAREPGWNVVQVGGNGQHFEVEHLGSKYFVDFSRHPLPFIDCIAFVSSGPAAHELALRFINCALPLKIDAHEVDLTNEGELRRVLDTISMSRLRRTGSLLLETQSELQAIRSDHEVLASKYEELELHLRRHDVAPCKLSWKVPRRPNAIVELSDGWAEVIGAPSWGLARVELYVLRSSAASPMQVELSNHSTEEVLCSWTINSVESAGWQIFDLDRTLSLAGAMLRLTIHPARGWSCGGSMPWLTSASLLEGGLAGREKAGLAIKTYSSLPGVARPFSSIGVTERRKLQRVITGDQLRTVRQIASEADEDAFPHVSFVDSQNGLLIHPRAEGVTTAIFDHLCPPSAKEVWLRIKHANDLGAPFLVTVEVDHHPARLDKGTVEVCRLPWRDLGQPESLDRLELGSWIRIDPGASAFLKFECGSATLNSRDVLVCTRRDPTDDVHNAWAIVEALAFELYGD